MTALVAGDRLQPASKKHSAHSEMKTLEGSVSSRAVAEVTLSTPTSLALQPPASQMTCPTRHVAYSLGWIASLGFEMQKLSAV